MTPWFFFAVDAPTHPLSDFLDAGRAIMHRLLFLPQSASTYAERIDGLQDVEFVFFWAIGVVLLGAAGLLAFVYLHRGDPDERLPTPRVVAPLWAEFALSGFLLAVFLAFWVVGYRQYVFASTPPPQAIDVYVTGKQWMWKFAYADGPTSAGVLYVPEHRPVRLVLTSRDVIHSFFVPDFRMKQDAVPGRYTSIWFEATHPGRFQILCAEFCGAGHSRMWGEVVVLRADEYESWLQGVQPRVLTDPVDEPHLTSPTGGPHRLDNETMAHRGLEVAARYGCLRCHTTDGTPHIGPTWLGLYGSRVELANGSTVTADEAYLTESMMDPENKIVTGYQPLMPTFQGRMQPGDVAAVVELIRALAKPGGSTVAAEPVPPEIGGQP
jgi:cytochrome c oxidase subunit 2